MPGIKRLHMHKILHTFNENLNGLCHVVCRRSETKAVTMVVSYKHHHIQLGQKSVCHLFPLLCTLFVDYIMPQQPGVPSP